MKRKHEHSLSTMGQYVVEATAGDETYRQTEFQQPSRENKMVGSCWSLESQSLTAVEINYEIGNNIVSWSSGSLATVTSSMLFNCDQGLWPPIGSTRQCNSMMWCWWADWERIQEWHCSPSALWTRCPRRCIWAMIAAMISDDSPCPYTHPPRMSTCTQILEASPIYHQQAINLVHLDTVHDGLTASASSSRARSHTHKAKQIRPLLKISRKIQTLYDQLHLQWSSKHTHRHIKHIRMKLLEAVAHY